MPIENGRRVVQCGYRDCERTATMIGVHGAVAEIAGWTDIGGTWLCPEHSGEPRTSADIEVKREVTRALLDVARGCGAENTAADRVDACRLLLALHGLVLE